jgi:hypothetical protein
LAAFSLASAPPSVKKKVLMSPGVISAMSLPRRARDLRRRLRVDEDQLVELPLHRRDDLGVGVTDEHAHQLRVEVQDALPLGRVEVHPLGARDGQRVDRR